MSHAALSPEQFTFVKATPKEMGGTPHHQLVMGDPKSYYQASLAWHHKTGEIWAINVDPEHQRQGIATAMWHRAHEIAAETRGVKPPRHSPNRTQEGEMWARSLGGRLPKRQL